MDAHDWPELTEPLPLAGDIVHVVRLNLHADPSRIERMRSVLSPDELTRADRYNFDEPRQRFIVCRAALRQLLGECLNREAGSLAFTYGPHGKPMLMAGNTKAPLTLALSPQGRGEGTGGQTQFDFSVSHSADLALIAITVGRRVGVDVERHDAKVRIHKLATRFFSPREAAELASLPECDQLVGFYRGWTCKEAYLKATGFGLSFPLSKFTVALNPHSPVSLQEVTDLPDEAARWQMHSLNVADDFSAALLVETSSRELVSVRQWSFVSDDDL
jgi:4'-phosphopantetheinyl transferase